MNDEALEAAGWQTDEPDRPDEQPMDAEVDAWQAAIDMLTLPLWGEKRAA